MALNFTDSEIVATQTSDLHIIRGKWTGNHNYRAELRKIDDSCTEFIFGKVDNMSDYYVCVLRCKLYTCAEEKIAFIVDLCGFANNLWEPIEVYTLHGVQNYWRASQDNLDLFDLSLKRMYPGWEIRNYNEDKMCVFELTRNIFNNVINYPHDLENLMIKDIVEKIHHLNSPEKINIDDEKLHYDQEKIKALWNDCDNTCSDYGTIAVWFGFDKDYDIL
jgi:hypothetical protein